MIFFKNSSYFRHFFGFFTEVLSLIYYVIIKYCPIEAQGQKEGSTMKTFRFFIIAFLSISLSSFAFANKVVIEQTEGWTAVPVVVDVDKHTFVAPQYYYSYQGHRCFAEKQTFAGIDAIIFHADINGGTTIYCYPED